MFSKSKSLQIYTKIIIIQLHCLAFDRRHQGSTRIEIPCPPPGLSLSSKGESNVVIMYRIQEFTYISMGMCKYVLVYVCVYIHYVYKFGKQIFKYLWMNSVHFGRERGYGALIDSFLSCLFVSFYSIFKLIKRLTQKLECSFSKSKNVFSPGAMIAKSYRIQETSFASGLLI